MLGHKAREFRQYTTVSLDDLIPEDNFYRQVEACIDLSFVRDLVSGYYADNGRPSIDPVVFCKLQVIAFFEGIRSERHLMETVNLNLAHRWFIGYDLEEALPDHSSLSKIRERYGLDIFHQFFERVVSLCIEAGLVWGEELYLNSTKVQANAAFNSMVDMVDREEYEAQRPRGQPAEKKKEENPSSSLADMIAKYDGERLSAHRTPSYQRVTDERISPVDPDAAPMRPSGGGRAVLGYRDHYVVDGGKARIILSRLVAPASIRDNTPMLDLVRQTSTKWQIKPHIAVGDAKFGTIQNIVGLEDMGIKAYMRNPDLGKRTGYYPPEEFRYDVELDQYICPQGQRLSPTRGLSESDAQAGGVG